VNSARLGGRPNGHASQLIASVLPGIEGYALKPKGGWFSWLTSGACWLGPMSGQQALEKGPRRTRILVGPVLSQFSTNQASSPTPSLPWSRAIRDSAHRSFTGPRLSGKSPRSPENITVPSIPLASQKKIFARVKDHRGNRHIRGSVGTSSVSRSARSREDQIHHGTRYPG
jgi:hypothetical protein